MEYGIGLYEMTGNGKIQWNKVVKNPCIISSVLGFVLFFFGVIYKMPNVVTKPVFYLASCDSSSLESFGVCGSNCSNKSNITSLTTNLVNHLLSAGTTYQGA